MKVFFFFQWEGRSNQGNIRGGGGERREKKNLFFWKAFQMVALI